MKLAAAALAGLLCAAGLAAGDVQAGRAVFEKQGCIACHTAGNQGGALGPDLTDIAVLRSPESLRLSLTDPDAEIPAPYVTVTVLTRKGDEIRGIRLNEDDYSLQIRDVGGNLRSFLKSDLQDVRREMRSLMPSYATRLSQTELDDLVAYLMSLRRDAPETSGEPRTRGPSPLCPAENAAWFTRPDRDATEQPEKVLDALQIPEGAQAADIGAGPGYFTWRLAQRVGPKGKVYAEEIQQKMLDLIAADLKPRGLTNVELVLGDERDPKLPERTLDLALLVSVYHEFTEPEAMMTALRRALKPEGRVALVEYRKEDPASPILGLHKLSVEEARTEIEPLGFRLERVLEFLPTQHILIFTKRPSQ